MSTAKTILAAALRFASEAGLNADEVEAWVSPELRDKLKQEPSEQHIPNIPADIAFDIKIRVVRAGLLEPGSFVIVPKFPKPVTPDPRTIN